MSELDQDKIKYAKSLIKKMHPLNNLEVELCLPFLDPVIGVARRCMGGTSALFKQKNEETASLANADGLKADTEDPEGHKPSAVDEDGDLLFDFHLDEGEDPIGRLGYGVVSYFSLIYTMMLIFLLITAFFTPVIMNNMQWKAYESEKMLSWTAATTLGNLGASETRCSTLKMVGDTASIGCNSGKITEITAFGVYAKGSEADQKGMCSTEGLESMETGLDCSHVNTEHAFYTDKLSKCVGQASCVMKGVHEDLPLGAQSFPNMGCELKPSTTMYIQYSCKIDKEEMKTKRDQALLAGCTSMFSCLVLLAVLNYRQGSISIEKREWDLQTVTASDYTIELKIKDPQYEAIMKKIAETGFMAGESQGMRFKLFYKKLIEDRVNELSEGQGGRVADINFAYKNQWLLDSMYERGDCIKYKQWDELNKLNKTITERMHEDMENLCTPIAAFVCMESETAYNFIAVSEKIDIFGTESSVKEASEPTNIIWENYHANKIQRAARMFMILVAVCTVLFITFLATTYAKGLTNEATGKYDESIKCSDYKKMYDDKTLQELAADEWVDYYEGGGEDMERLVSSVLSCFCTAQYTKVGNDAADMKWASSTGRMVSTCSEIFADRAYVGYIAMAVSMLIVMVNFILKVILVELVKSLRLKTVTAETNYTMIAIFVGQFVNTAVLVVLNNASFHDFDDGVGPLSQMFRVGTMTDFNVDWYKTVGTLLMKTLLMAGLWPLIEFAMFWSMIAFFRWMDKGFGSDEFFSKSPSLQAYIDTWAGPIYLIHYRYATILLQIGCAFLYGTGMPLLYFYAFIAYAILYLNERLLVCYYYREPPAFDEKMTMLCLDLSGYVPYLMLPFGFWMLGNRQIFEDIVHPINFKSDIKLSDHTITTAMTHMDPQFMTYNSNMLWLFFALMFYQVYAYFFIAEEEEDEDDQLVEGLDDYYVALKKEDKAIAIGQEETMIRQYGVKTFEDQQFNDLKTAGTADLEKIIMGVATYRMLESLQYQQAMQYEPAKKKDDGTCQRDGNIIVSTQEGEETKHTVNEPEQQDVTYLAVNLAYVPDNKKATLNFDTSNGKRLF